MEEIPRERGGERFFGAISCDEKNDYLEIKTCRLNSKPLDTDALSS